MKPRVQDIINVACTVFEIERDKMLSPTRGVRREVRARHAAMFLAREITGYSYPRIGAEFDRDHTTVLHACRDIEARRMRNEAMQARLDLCRGHLVALMQERERNWAAAMCQPLVMEAAE